MSQLKSSVTDAQQLLTLSGRPPSTSLPSTNPTISYWQSPPSHLADFRSTPTLPSHATTVIIGSGITGVSIAHKLLQRDPSVDILMLEARQACSGATGRNGGHCRPGRYLKFPSDCAAYGLPQAIKLARFEEQTVREVYALITAEHIDCDFRELETVDLFFDEQQWEAAILAVQMRAQALPPYEDGGLPSQTLHTAAEARERFQAPTAVGACSFGGATLSAYKLAIGILEMALRKGLKLQTTTPVLSIAQTPSKTDDQPHQWTIHTPRGAIHAHTVILATNAYTPHLYPPLAHTILPTRGQVSALRPGSLFPHTAIPTRSFGIYTRASNDYMHSATSGAVIIGGGRLLAPGKETPLLDDSATHPLIATYLAGAPLTHFGAAHWGQDAREGRTLQEWTGIMAYTPDGNPLVGEARGERGLWVCAGFNGHGMALAYRCAEAVVGMVRGEGERERGEWFPEVYRLGRV
ncbi:hypothetical protein MMC17_004857 [Xylographa soralifera]|nr:hypothetical protein [Xylographa soralifera]